MSLQESEESAVSQSSAKNRQSFVSQHQKHRSKSALKADRSDTDLHTAEETRYEEAFYQLVAAVDRWLEERSTSQQKSQQTKLSKQPLARSQFKSHFKLSVFGEQSQFTRFNNAKIRQSGQVCDGQITLTLISARHQTATVSLPFVGEIETDWSTLRPLMEQLHQEIFDLPVDPYVVLPSVEPDRSSSHSSKEADSREIQEGNLLTLSELADSLLTPVESLDFSGLYASGYAYRGYADSAGRQHWFATPSFTLDYSLFGQAPEHTTQKHLEADTKLVANKLAVKGTLAGNQWRQRDYQQSIEAAAKQLTLSSVAKKRIERGRYRTYLAPTAVAEIIDTIACSGGLGAAALRQGNSAFGRLERGETELSHQFSLGEDFQRSGRPRFNTDGEIAPSQLPIVQNGRWVTALVNGRSEKEYGQPSNGANQAEAMRAVSVAPGSLRKEAILSELETGLYVSNLHYLNWSDLSAGHITGMTRYACFWVEYGKIVAPIENLRFDDDLYRFLGEGLMAVTDWQTYVPATGTYNRRSLGGMWVPGMLIESFRYTL